MSKTASRTYCRILIYGLNYAPENTGIGKYTTEMAKWLAAQGHEVRVVTSVPYYPGWQIREEYRGTFYCVEDASTPGAPTVYRTPLYVPAIPSGLKRVAHLASFMLGSVPVMLRQVFWKPDVVWTVEPTFFGAPLALLVAGLTNAASWLHVQDFEVEAAFSLGLLPQHGLVERCALSLAHRFTGCFARVSSISNRMVERSIAGGVCCSRAVFFPNWVDLDSIWPQASGADDNPFRRELGLEGKTVLLYSGNMGQKQGIEVLAPLAAAFDHDPSVHFIFCGEGISRSLLQELVGNRANVTMLPLQDCSRLNDLLNAADIHLLPQRADAEDLVMPSKLTGMLASGRPVVAMAGEGTQVAAVIAGRRGVVDEPCGLSVPAGDLAGMVAAVKRLVRSPEERARMGSAARRYAVQHLGTEQVLTRFEQSLLSLVDRSDASTKKASRGFAAPGLTETLP